MTKGVLIYAHNNETVDYVRLASVSAKLATKYLKVPVSLVTDKESVSSTSATDIFKIFDKIIYTDQVSTDNKRLLFDGTEQVTVSFLNANRHQAWNLTPYQQTLLIDSDFLIFSDRYSSYWDIDESFLITEGVNDFSLGRFESLENFVSLSSIRMRWATAIMFKKDETSKLIFDLVEHIRNNYDYYTDIYGCESSQFRNDIGFSIAYHMICGFTDSGTYLPIITMATQSEPIYFVDKKIFLQMNNKEAPDNPVLVDLSGVDIHLMNKFDILNCEQEILKYA